MTLEQIQLVHETIQEGDWVDAANLALEADGVPDRVETNAEAVIVLQMLEKNLAEEERFVEVAVLLWGNSMFDSRPSVVKSVFESVLENNKLIIFGGSSLSKTFSCGVLFYLQWRMDSHWTAVKLAAPSEDHLYTNLFSHIIALHRAAVIPMTDNDAEKVRVSETEMVITMSDAIPEMGIKGLLCKQSQVSAGALRGHKPKPYRKPLHPKFGDSTRIFILIDEATQVSPGAFADIDTTLGSIEGTKGIGKIVIACNPEGVTYKIVQMAEPEEGWDPDQVDTLYKWTSKQGWPVLRLDGKKFENVVERRIIYPRMLTYEAFLGFLKAGEHSGSYWAKGRGFPPLKDNAWTIVPPAYMQGSRGDPIYTGNVVNIAIVDTALQGSDKAMMGVGRFGEAAGYYDIQGQIQWFVDRADPEKKVKRHVAVLDQLMQLPKTSSTVEIIQEVMGRCKRANILPENTVFDATGNAAGVVAHAKKYWGNVLGVQFGNAASEELVLAEHTLTANDQFDGKVTELWFAMKAWLDPVVGCLFINPIVPTNPLFNQVTTRRYRPVKGGRVRVEPKEEYRARNSGASPDEADVLCLLIEWCRQRGGYIPGIQESRMKNGGGKSADRVSLLNADEPDTIGNEEWVSNRLDAE